MCTIAPVRLKDLIASVGAHQPPIELEVFDSTADELEKRLEQGRLEIAIYCRPDHQSSRLHYVPLFRERMMAVVSQQHSLANRPFVRFKELENERYLKRLNCEFDESRAWERNGVAWKATHWSEREDWILEMCAAGIGFGFLPEYSINHPRVVALKIVEPEFWREVNVATVRGREHSPAVGGRSCG
jgi:LysR family hydrogen peroxide-inducible transcriptional activator